MRLTDEGWGDDDRDPAKLVRAALDEGVSLLDTAEMYGNEELVGRALGSIRDQVILCSKFGVYWGDSGRDDDWTVRADPATVRSAIDGSLRRLNVDHLDLYYLHHRSEDTPIEETVTAMAELKQAGKIRALGLSNVTLDDIRRAHAVHPIAAVQDQWSLNRRGVEEFLPTLSELGIALVAHSPLGHGVLNQDDAGDSPLARVASQLGVTTGQVALAWVHHRGRQADCTVIPLPGTSSVNHLRANVAASRIELSESSVRSLEDAVDFLTDM
ncbi:putative aldo/keto reductase [Gordonia araii NBRC 100433]|uniref:Putative aldo/keto reductase n=2 Tax=Gordonia araii TaxID=263909 RepID=G7H3W7_9ACTN|nr:aldo/keto reductase [Gordonia araii]NNG99098.1 aldo/keto reductase [Gordonia araii NBRC 100433]GAB10542.1 putative aldo/keto reductase [Gordonia araii NBRC 100433]